MTTPPFESRFVKETAQVKKGIDKVQSNHAELAAALMGEEESESASETETSSSEEEDDETVTTRSKPSKGMMPMRSKR